MNHSESLKAIAPALVALQGEMVAVARTADNPFFHSKYADLAACMEALKAPCLKNGLAILQAPSAINNTIQVTTTVLHTSGEWVSADAAAVPKDLTPQNVGSAITYLRRYGLSLVGLVTDDDNDGNQTDPKAQAPTPPHKASPNAGKPAKEAGKPEKAPEAAPLPPAASGKPRLTVPQVKAMCAKPSQNCTYAQLGAWLKEHWAIDGLSQGEVIAEHSDEIRLYLDGLHSDV